MDQENHPPPEDTQPLRDHPFYRSGLAQAGAGQWNQALRTFQSLQTLYPDDPELQDLLKEARMRGTLSQLQPKHRKKYRRLSGPKRWGLLFLTIVVAAIIGYLVYVFWIDPVFLQEWRIQQIVQLRNQADEAIASGDYSQAQESLQQLQQLLPQDPEAVASLQKVGQLKQVSQLYNQARNLLQTENWDEAIATLSELRALDSQYRDSEQLLQQAREFKKLDQQLVSAEQSLADGDWETAISRLDTIHQANLAFKYDLIQKRLFESHLAYGHHLLAESGKTPQQVEQALSQIDLALKISPVDATALNDRRLTETYLKALNSEQPDDQIDLLQTLYNERSALIEQDVLQLLYAALLQRAELSLSNGELEAAVDDVQRAAKLPVEDPSMAQEKLSSLLAESSPN